MRMSKHSGRRVRIKLCVGGEREREHKTRTGSACGSQLASFIWSTGAMSTEESKRPACCRKEGGREGAGEVLKWMNEKKEEGEGALSSRLLSVREEAVSLALCSRYACVKFHLFLEPRFLSTSPVQAC